MLVQFFWKVKYFAAILTSTSFLHHLRFKMSVQLWAVLEYFITTGTRIILNSLIRIAHLPMSWQIVLMSNVDFTYLAHPMIIYFFLCWFWRYCYIFLSDKALLSCMEMSNYSQYLDTGSFFWWHYFYLLIWTKKQQVAS